MKYLLVSIPLFTLLLFAVTVTAQPPPPVWEPNFGVELTDLTGQDNATQVVGLGFNFPFFDAAHNVIYVSTKGVISLGQDAALDHTPLADDFINVEAPVIAPFWSDMSLSVAGKVFANLSPNHNRAVITWSGIGSFRKPGASFSFQVQLLAIGQVVFAYNGIPNTLQTLDTDLLVGISSGNGGREGLALSPGNARKIRFINEPPDPNVQNDTAHRIIMDATVYEIFTEGAKAFNLNRRNLIFIPPAGRRPPPPTTPTLQTLGPRANFEADPLDGEPPGLEVTFTDTSLPGGQPITSWEWDFDNDGVVDSTEQNPVYTYTEPGTYTVRLMVSDGTLSDKRVKDALIRLRPFQTGDLDGDSRITTDDATLILEFIAGLINEFPVTSGLGQPASANQPRHYTISVPSIPVKSSAERLVVPVHLSEQNHLTDFSGGALTLKYDATVLKARHAFLNLNGTYYGQVNLNRRGEVRVAFLSEAPLSTASRILRLEGEGTDAGSNPEHTLMLLVEFDVLSGTHVRTTPLTLSHAQLARSTSIQMHDGMLTFHPEALQLLQNFPNPFNPETWIPFHLKEAADVSIVIYDVHGQIVQALQLGPLAAGYYDERHTAAYWDGRSDTGERVASGMYFYQLNASSRSQIRRMLVVK